MQCNIDARGRFVRIVMGLAFALAGGLVLLADRLLDPASGWLIVVGLTLLGGGIVGIVEGWAGWCVVRGLGFRTRL